MNEAELIKFAKAEENKQKLATALVKIAQAADELENADYFRSAEVLTQILEALESKCS